MGINRDIDHIVYAVPDLYEAMDRFERLTEVRPVYGGQHTTEGTANALVNLGSGAYLEFLAIDKSNTEVVSNRWMGIDLITTPMVTRWALKSQNLQADAKVLQEYNTQMGFLKGGRRKMADGKFLTWELAMPLPTPQVEIIPFMTDWQNSDAHPTDELPEICRLLELKLSHDQPELCSDTLNKIGYDCVVEKGECPEISLSIVSPKGIVIL